MECQKPKINNQKLPIGQSGQGLIEVLASMAIAMVVLTALTVAAVTSVKNANYAKNLSQANILAQEAMDAVRAYRDLHPTDFFANKGDGCYQIDPANLSSVSSYSLLGDSLPCTGARTNPAKGQRLNTIFYREIAARHDVNPDCNGAGAGTCVKITVNVFWTDSSGVRQVVLDGIFGKWDQGITN